MIKKGNCLHKTGHQIIQKGKTNKKILISQLQIKLKKKIQTLKLASNLI